DPKVVEVRLSAQKAKVTLEAGREVEMYTYNGVFPGPLLQARAGDRVVVHFTNQLPESTTIHWHGLRISDQMDGSPRIQAPVPAGGTFTYDFVAPEEGSFWYHPHIRANEQVEKGLYGPIVIRSEDEPRYDAERFLLLDDIYLQGSTLAPFLEDGMEAMHGRYGNILLTNGVPFGEGLSAVVERGRMERWRIVNTANARTMELTLKNAAFRVIGTDGGLLPAPYTTSRLELSVGQRYELEVTFENPGSVELQMLVATSNGSGQVVETPYTVFALDVAVSGVSPRAVSWPLRTLPQRVVDETVTVELDGVNDPVHGLRWQINGQSHPTAPLFTFKKGRTVRMRLVNLAGPEHPFHLHGQFFQVVSDSSRFSVPPGLKDTVLVPGLSTVEIEAYMDNPGRWMAHCHILEHAELGMMAELVVEP
ncbi:MAG: multicopper oxidase family protein, partial [Myxococcota bacterium]